MKRVFYFVAVVCLVLLAATGCTPKDEVDEPVAPDALYGYWKKPNANQYLRFMTEEEDTRDGEYLFGYEFDLDDDVLETDLWEQYHGNGWFKYKMTVNQKDTTLHEIILMDNQGADIPKTYIIQSLTATTLSYKDGNLPYTYTKTVKP